MNIHLDHINKKAHIPCLEVILNEKNKIEDKYKDISFVLIGGCFYCEEIDEEIKFLKNKNLNEIIFDNTYHGFTGIPKNHWDYLFFQEKNTKNITVSKSKVLKNESIINELNHHFISDHFPVYAEFSISN